VALVEYRFSGEAHFPACLHDVKAAVRWLRQFGGRVGVNGEAIGVWGESAGGHLAAFIAMVHDLLVTVGIFSLFGFQITPDTVIALLTILGYSLYDTVVVFDRVRDNTGGVLKAGDMSYGEMVNLSMNQTLARSINTSLVAIMPTLSVLIVGAYILGATTLQNYGLALVVGLFSGAYSSIFIASPLLASFKEREPRFRELAERVAAKTDRRVVSPAAAAAMLGAEGPQRSSRSTTRAAGSPVQARPRKQKRR